MMNRKVMAVGYPIGFSEIQGNEFFNVQLSEKIYPLNLLTSYVWIHALDCYSKEELLQKVLDELFEKGYTVGKDFTLDDLNEVYSNLEKECLIIEIEVVDTTLLDFHRLSKAKFSKQGFGLGITDGSIYIAKESSKVEISNSEYLVWQLSNEVRTLEEIFEAVVRNIENTKSIHGLEIQTERIKLQMIKDIYSLYMKDLLQITSI